MEKRKIILNILMIILGVAFILGMIILVSIFSSTSKKIQFEKDEFYQYFSGIKQEYNNKIEIKQENNEKTFELEDGTVVMLDSVPIFYKNDAKMILPQTMEVIYPTLGSSYKTEEFSSVNYQNEAPYIQKYGITDQKTIENSFIFDGNDVYIFLEKTTLQVGETQYELSPLSYVIATYKQSVEIYNYETDEYTIIDDANLTTDVKASNEDKTYSINLSVDSVKSGNNERLLIKNISYLDTLEY